MLKTSVLYVVGDSYQDCERQNLHVMSNVPSAPITTSLFLPTSRGTAGTVTGPPLRGVPLPLLHGGHRGSKGEGSRREGGRGARRGAG